MALEEESRRLDTRWHGHLRQDNSTRPGSARNGAKFAERSTLGG